MSEWILVDLGYWSEAQDNEFAWAVWTGSYSGYDDGSKNYRCPAFQYDCIVSVRPERVLEKLDLS